MTPERFFCICPRIARHYGGDRARSVEHFDITRPEIGVFSPFCRILPVFEYNLVQYPLIMCCGLRYVSCFYNGLGDIIKVSEVAGSEGGSGKVAWAVVPVSGGKMREVP